MKRTLTGFLFAAMLICTTHAGYASGPTSTAPPDYSFVCDHMYTINAEGKQLSDATINANITFNSAHNQIVIHSSTNDIMINIIGYGTETYNGRSVPYCKVSMEKYQTVMVDVRFVIFIPNTKDGQMLVFKTCGSPGH